MSSENECFGGTDPVAASEIDLERDSVPESQEDAYKTPIPD